MDETLDGLDEDQDELEEEADAEVDKVLFDLTDGKLGVLTGKVGGALPVRLRFFLRLVHSKKSHIPLTDCLLTTPLPFAGHQTKEAQQTEDDSEAEMQRMQRELQDLLSS